jgi:hypothetical protein
MTEREDLELERRTAPKRSEKCGQKSGQEMPEGKSKEKGQLPVYQSDRILREPQIGRSHLVNQTSNLAGRRGSAAATPVPSR